MKPIECKIKLYKGVKPCIISMEVTIGAFPQDKFNCLLGDNLHWDPEALHH
jgi:hypothetical protein